LISPDCITPLWNCNSLFPDPRIPSNDVRSDPTANVRRACEPALAHVFLQGYYMPPIFKTWKRYGSLVRDSVVVHLHGPDREGIKKETGENWNKIVAPKDEYLDRLVEMMRDMRDRSLTVYLNINNQLIATTIAFR
jgi:hypothetical protein